MREAIEKLRVHGETRDLETYATGFILHQMSAKQGVRKHGEKALTALHNEFLQLHDTKTYVPVSPKDITFKQKKNSLKAIIVLKKERCGKLKGRTCADGRKQKLYKTKAETVSPTVHTIFLLFIDTVYKFYKKRKLFNSGAYNFNKP